MSVEQHNFLCLHVLVGAENGAEEPAAAGL